MTIHSASRAVRSAHLARAVVLGGALAALLVACDQPPKAQTPALDSTPTPTATVVAVGSSASPAEDFYVVLGGVLSLNPSTLEEASAYALPRGSLDGFAPPAGSSGSYPRTGSEYTAVAWNADGDRIDGIDFVMNWIGPESDAEEDGALVWIGIPAGSGAVRVAFLEDRATIHEWSAGASVPVVEGVLVKVNGDEIAVSWDASDADGDVTMTEVTILGGDGSFAGNAFPSAEGAVTLQRSDVGGSGPFVALVAVSDGIHVGQGRSAAFDLGNTSPWLVDYFVHDEVGGVVTSQGGTVVFDVTAYDSEDGTLDDDAITWSSDIDGFLTTGSELYLNGGDQVLDGPTLTPGRHVLTATAIDSGGAAGTLVINYAFIPPSG
jgi:hypothetical protein